MTGTETQLMLSHSGLRGIVGQSLTDNVATRYAAAIGRALTASAAKRPATVVVGRDSRPSGNHLESAVLVGLAAAGCRVIRLGIVTTPGVAVMVRHHRAAGGVIVTASHNPTPWNGIKMLTPRGTAPTPHEADEVIRAFTQHDPADDKSGNMPAKDDLSTPDTHVARIGEQVDVATIRAHGFHAVIDSVHGAGGPSTALLASALGVCTTHLYADPTGNFPHDPEPTKDHLITLCSAVRKEGADIGFAQDPDADRLAIVDERGDYIGEEYTLALCARHTLARCPRSGPTVLAANLSTSRMLDDAAEAHGARVVRTAVGEANVAAAMLDHDALIGGEGNGGVIWPPVAMVRDSLMGIALILEMIALAGKPLSEIVAAIPRYSIVKRKIPIAANAITREVLGPLFEDAYRVNEADGLRFDWDNRWVHIRASNTEPVVRIIAEASSEAEASEMVDAVQAKICEG